MFNVVPFNPLMQHDLPSYTLLKEVNVHRRKLMCILQPFYFTRDIKAPQLIKYYTSLRCLPFQTIQYKIGNGTMFLSVLNSCKALLQTDINSNLANAKSQSQNQDYLHTSEWLPGYIIHSIPNIMSRTKRPPVLWILNYRQTKSNKPNYISPA